MQRWSHLMEHIEVYGERHRAIRKLRVQTDKEQLGDIFKKLGESFKLVEFNISELILSIEPEKK